MSFFCYELALNQDIQDRLRSEIEEIVERYNGEVTYDGIKEMKYLDMVFNETLRIYPVVDTHVRKCTKDFKIPNSDLVIPAGAAVLIPAIGLHHDEKYFENPDVFDPNRFSDENIKKLVPHTFIPFCENFFEHKIEFLVILNIFAAEGHRMCIGQR